MMTRLLPLLLGLLLISPATGDDDIELTLHPMFNDHAVLQRGVPIPVLGTTSPGALVSVKFAGQNQLTKADAKGHWYCTLDPMPASAEGREFEVASSGSHNRITLEDVLVGEVWLCSGQSNMEWGITRIGEDEEIAKADHPQLRLLTVPHKVAYKPDADFYGSWSVCSPETLKKGALGGFSATAYFFGKKLQQELKVPVGLIHSSWGGTTIEAWTSMETLGQFPELKGQLKQLGELAKSQDPEEALNRMMDEWFQKHDVGTQQGWHKGTADTSDWKDVKLPGSWRDFGIAGHEGITWLQREFKTPKHWAGKPMYLGLGTISDTDTVWINGVEVGRTHSFERLTRYSMKGGIVKADNNVITLRITNAGGGGIFGKDIPNSFFIGPHEIIDGYMESVIINDEWKLKTTATMAKTGRPIAGNPQVGSVLYNGMIAPLRPYPMKGVIWYQGEANASQPDMYAKLLPAMIADWRERLDQGDLAFHVVSLANYMDRSEVPRDHGWAGLREAQAMAAKKVPHCGLAVTIDIGDANNIHPKNKRDVGLRLALSALERTYRKEVVGSGPWYREMKVEDGKIRLEFDYAEGLKFKGDTDKAFAIAGKDGKYVWAKAEIEGKSVIVSSPDVPKPVAVRYAWDANPQAPLYNAADLPAVPFRTDGL